MTPLAALRSLACPRGMPKTDPLLADWRTDPWDEPAALPPEEFVRAPRDGKGARWLLFVVVLLVIGALLAAGLGGRWVLSQVAPPGDPGDPVNFTVAQGESVPDVVERLQAEGIITNARVFRWYIDRKGGLDLQPGYYTLRPQDDLGNILSTLRTPPEQTYEKVTFPEGFTVTRMGERLQETVPRLSATRFQEVAGAGEIRSTLAPDATNLEGLLFPDTYQIGGNENEGQIVSRLVQQMERVANREGIANAPQKVGLTPYQVLVIASMIEREAGVDADRPLIARVIYNRLFLGMPLQIDATLFYGAPAGLDFGELLERESPYNTYKVAGLPPTPIANPGRKSIAAALDPAPNPDPSECGGAEPCLWLYYVLAAEDGSHVFATGLEQHEENVARSRAQGLL
jgi:UPF0755 protein